MRQRWLSDGSEAAVRAGLTAALPGLAVEKLEIHPRHTSSNPLWWSSSAFVNDALVAKFAWSEVRAARLHREGVLLQRLPDLAPGLPVPELVALTESPVMVITRMRQGEPLSWRAGTDLQDQRLHAAAEALAEFLVDLHRLGVDDIFRELPQVRPTAQSDTERLRAEYGQLVDEGRDRLVRGWCDWIDHVLGDPAGDVVVHGDFHGYNQLWDFNAGELVAVLDFEECGPGDRHFDFRYLPGNSASTELMLAVVDAYERRTEGELSLQRIMAWHILTVLGDALWRTQAGVELPGGGDACSYVDEVQQRLEVLGVSPAS